MAFVSHDTSIDFLQRVAQGARDAALDYNVFLTFTGPPTIDQPAQIGMWDALIQTKPDAMVVIADDPAVWAAPVKRATDAGILVLTVDTDVPNSTRTAFLGPDPTLLGKNLGDAVHKLIGDQGKVVVGICVLGPSVHAQRMAGFQSAFAGTSVKILGPYETNCDATQNFTNWSNLYTANPDAAALVGLTAVETASLGKLKQQTGGKFIAASFDPGAVGLQQMLSGYLSVCVGQNPYLDGYLPIQAIAKHFRNGSVIKPGINLYPGEFITPQTAQALIERENMGAPMKAWYKDFIAKNNLADFGLQ